MSKRKREANETDSDEVASVLGELVDRVVSQTLTEKRKKKCAWCKSLAHVTADGKERTLCVPCLKIARERTKRRVTRAAEKLGHRVCSQCACEKPLAEFAQHAEVKNRKRRNRTCRSCTDEMAERRRTDPRRQACQAFWNTWKQQPCAHCGVHNPDVIEADHVIKGSKTEGMSNIGHWTFNGGVGAMEREAEKCQPLCRVCHRVKSRGEYTEEKKDRVYSTSYGAVMSQRYRERNRAFVNKRKLEAGECVVCKRGVTEETLCAFDWMHESWKTKGRYGSKQAGIGVLVDTCASLKRVDEELAKCRLACANCHKQETDAENAKRLEADSDMHACSVCV